MSARAFGNGRRCIGAPGIVNVDIVGPSHRLQAAGEILLFILCKDENGNHSGLTATRIIEQANVGIRPTRMKSLTEKPVSQASCDNVLREKNLTCPKSL